MNNEIQVILKETLFLAKSLDFFEDFLNPGKDYNIIAIQSSKQLIEKYPNVYVDEVSRGKRKYASSKIFLDILNNSEEYKKYYNIRNISTYQAYPWTNDLKLSGKNVFAIDYYIFLKLQNKLSQRKLLLEYSSLSYDLKELMHSLENSTNKFRTRVFHKNQFSYKDLTRFYNGCFVICASISNGGEGVYKISTPEEYSQAITSIESPVIRTEYFIDDSIPTNQIGFITSEGLIIKYKPSIQIIKNIHQDNKMEYAGCDFTFEKYFQEPDKIMSNMSKLTHLIGMILFNIGYRGTFGCDYLVKDNEIHFIEINPRYQASTQIPNIHLSNEDLIAPHILHILGFIENYSIAQQLKQYGGKNFYIDFVKPDKPIGFLKIFDTSIANVRKPLPFIEIEKGLPIGYCLYEESFIKSPFFPVECKQEKTII